MILHVDSRSPRLQTKTVRRAEDSMTLANWWVILILAIIAGFGWAIGSWIGNRLMAALA